MESLRTDELFGGAPVDRVETKLRFNTEIQASRRGVPAWRVHVSCGDQMRRTVVPVTVWAAEEPELRRGQVVRFQDVVIGASEQGRLWVTAGSWVVAK